MKNLTSKQLTVITNNINADKQLMKRINANIYTSVESFIENAIAYINAIEQNRMLCIVKSVSSSGMSRVLKFNSFEIYKKSENKNKGGYYRNYYTLFKHLGYTEVKNEGFRVNGCGMDMVFHTNYSIIRSLYNLGFISLDKCRILEQNTPTCL